MKAVALLLLAVTADADLDKLRQGCRRYLADPPAGAKEEQAEAPDADGMPSDQDCAEFKDKDGETAPPQGLAQKKRKMVSKKAKKSKTSKKKPDCDCVLHNLEKENRTPEQKKADAEVEKEERKALGLEVEPEAIKEETEEETEETGTTKEELIQRKKKMNFLAKQKGDEDDLPCVCETGLDEDMKRDDALLQKKKSKSSKKGKQTPEEECACLTGLDVDGGDPSASLVQKKVRKGKKQTPEEECACLTGLDVDGGNPASLLQKKGKKAAKKGKKQTPEEECACLTGLDVDGGDPSASLVQKQKRSGDVPTGDCACSAAGGDHPTPVDPENTQ